MIPLFCHHNIESFSAKSPPKFQKMPGDFFFTLAIKMLLNIDESGRLKIIFD